MFHKLMGIATCTTIVYVMFLGVVDFMYQVTGWALNLFDRPVS